MRLRIGAGFAANRVAVDVGATRPRISTQPRRNHTGDVVPISRVASGHDSWIAEARCSVPIRDASTTSARMLTLPAASARAGGVLHGRFPFKGRTRAGARLLSCRRRLTSQHGGAISAGMSFPWSAEVAADRAVVQPARIVGEIDPPSCRHKRCNGNAKSASPKRRKIWNASLGGPRNDRGFARAVRPVPSFAARRSDRQIPWKSRV